MRSIENTLTIQDPCEEAYGYAVQDIYKNAEKKNVTFEELVLTPVIAAAEKIGKDAPIKLSRSKQHRLQSQVIYDVMHRLQAAGELDAADSIVWRQTDDTGEEWVEYTNGSGTVFALNCPGLKYGFGEVSKNKQGKKYDALFEKSYESENDYDIVKKLFDTTGEKKSHAKKKKLVRTLGTAGLAAATFVAGFSAMTALDGALKEVPTREATTSLNNPDIDKGSANTPEQEKFLNIQPRENFLTAEGNLEMPDYIFNAPAVGNTIYGYVRPPEESKFIGKELNQTPIDVVVPAANPQESTPQLQEYARNHPDFIPTYERGTSRGKKNAYWNGRAAGDFQKTALQEYGYSVAPGQPGNSVHLIHASTRNAGGGDLAALNFGDTIDIRTPLLDNNRYVYELIEVEVLDVDDEGNLTQAEKEKQIQKGHHANVTAKEVIYHYIGHEDEATLTIQICGDENGIPGGTEDTDPKGARIIYRFRIDTERSHIVTVYENLVDSLKNNQLL